jgi:hypothetical protein
MRITAAFLSAFVVGATAPPAAAACGPRAGMIEILKSRYAETQSGVGFVDVGTVVELYVSGEGSWTLLATNTAGLSCIIGSGTNWQGIAADKRKALDS